MRVLLLNPPWYDDQHPDMWGVRAGSRWPHFQNRPAPGLLPRYIPFPFFLAISATILKDAGHDVWLCDAVAEDLKRPELYKKIDQFRPELVFVETSTPSLKNDIRILKNIQAKFPKVFVVCGGIHDINRVPAMMAEHGTPNLWIAGEYDYALLDLIQRLEKGLDLATVPGLLDGHSITNTPAVVEDVNSLPAPYFEHLPIANYCDPVCGLPHPCIQTWLSRGCPFGCTFCVWPQIIYNNSRGYRRRDIDKTLDEVQLVIDRYGCESFYFDDDTTNIGEDRMIELSAKIKERGLDAYPWGMMARGDCMNNRMLDTLADAGMYCVKYGVESISPKLIDACNKNTRLEKLKNAIRYSREIGVKVHLTFTFGLPGETRETIRETMDFAKEINPESAQFSICTPFPGTRFYDDCKEQGYLITDNWDRFLGSGEAVVETPWLSAQELEREFHCLLEEWNEFVANRLEERQTRLVKDLTAEVECGKFWTFLGDREYGRFLWDRGGATVSDAFRKANGNIDDEDCQVVIASEHDEEKIWRRIRRRNPHRAQKALRLFG